jgi:cation diffusion facilitator CzcD-associated flavoprotein CzcO
VNKTDVAIIGAGPYGLSLAASLANTGVDLCVFGQPMAFWKKIAHAAPERYLKSYCFGTDIPVPQSVGFSDWSLARGLETFEPCAMSHFAEYGLDLQRRFVPFVREATLLNVEMKGQKFLLHTDDGEELIAERVIVATGLSHFEQIPRCCRRCRRSWRATATRSRTMRAATESVSQSSAADNPLLRPPPWRMKPAARRN